MILHASEWPTLELLTSKFIFAPDIRPALLFLDYATEGSCEADCFSERQS